MSLVQSTALIFPYSCKWMCFLRLQRRLNLFWQMSHINQGPELCGFSKCVLSWSSLKEQSKQCRHQYDKEETCTSWHWQTWLYGSERRLWRRRWQFMCMVFCSHCNKEHLPQLCTVYPLKCTCKAVTSYWSRGWCSCREAEADTVTASSSHVEAKKNAETVFICLSLSCFELHGNACYSCHHRML